MAALDTRPGVVDVSAYAGDTLTIAITAPSALVTGMTWDAEVRTAPDANAADATFTITPPSVADGPAFLVLDSATTRALAETGVATRVSRAGRAVQILRYSGVWDCQISANGLDPVTTLVQGSLTIDLDVTRIEQAP